MYISLQRYLRIFITDNPEVSHFAAHSIKQYTHRMAQFHKWRSHLTKAESYHVSKMPPAPVS